MLARIAETMYWLGRYVERVDDTLRLLEVQEETASESDSHPWTALLDICGASTAKPHRLEVVESLLTGEQAWSIRNAVRRARENARIVRDRITLEVWTAVNGFYLGFERRAGRVDMATPDSFYEWIRERCDLIWGTIDNTLIRDEGWAWMAAGRYVERTNMTARTLTEMMPTRFEHEERAMHGWLTLLRFVAGSHAFRRVASGTLRPLDAISFITRSPVFPRSLAFSVGECHQALTSAGHQGTQAARRLMRLRAELDFLDPTRVKASPQEIMQTVVGDLEAVHHDLQEEIFGLEPMLLATEYNSAL
jgi:uncharacterized alpha-E superfamily protein